MFVFTSIAVGLVLLPFAADRAYSHVVKQRKDRWEAAVERDEHGVRVGCSDFSVGEGDTALLMIHGFASSPAIFQKMAPALAERGYHCRAIRLPGFGESTEAMMRVHRSDWEQTIEDEVERLHKNHEHVWLVGHSLGGALSIRQLLKNPDSADGVILIAPLLDVSSVRSPLVRPRVLFNLARKFLSHDVVFESTYPVDFHAQDVDVDGQRDIFIPISIYDQMFAVVDEVHASENGVRVPMLMVLSREDKVTDFHAAQRYFVDAPADSKEILHMADAGHVIPLDHGWELVVDAADRFIQRTSAGAASTP